MLGGSGKGQDLGVPAMAQGCCGVGSGTGTQLRSYVCPVAHTAGGGRAAPTQRAELWDSSGAPRQQGLVLGLGGEGQDSWVPLLERKE